MAKKQKSVSGLKFGDRKNIVYNLISIGVEHAPDKTKDSGDYDEVIQHAQEADDNSQGADDHNSNFNANDAEGS